MDEISQLKEVLALEKKIWTKDGMKLFAELSENMISILKTILTKSPDNCSALINLGAIYSNLGRHEEAKEILTKAKDLHADDKNLFLNLGYVSINLREPKHIVTAYLQMAKDKEAGKYTFEAYFDPMAH